MIRIVRTRTLADLHAEIGRQMARGDAAVAVSFAAQGEAGELRDRTRSAEAARAGWEAAYNALKDDTVAAWMRIKAKAGDAHSGRSLECFRADLALTVLRREIELAKASGDEKLIDSIRILDHLIGEDGVLEQAGRQTDEAPAGPAPGGAS